MLKILRSTAPVLALLGAILTAGPVLGQSASDEAEVRATVRQLFDAMRAADGPAAAALFHEQARLHSMGEQNGQPALVTGDVPAFLQAVGTPRTEVWDERISNLEVRVDGDLATAWMNYSFFVDDRFSHCGVNAFQFVRTDGRWRVLQITDTRRTEGCG